MSCNQPLIDAIDALLPQTQCRLCEYAGCRPYAEAIAIQGETIDRCLPGGVKTLRALGALLRQDPEPYVPAMAKKTKPPARAIIREAECIGCTKCIQACPVDAIIGASKQMHTVIADVCTGCELCISPCPVDCIDIAARPADQSPPANQSKQRYQNHEMRLREQAALQQQQHQATKLEHTTNDQTLAARQAAIAAAVVRAKAKKYVTIQHADGNGHF